MDIDAASRAWYREVYRCNVRLLMLDAGGMTVGDEGRSSRLRVLPMTSESLVV